MLRVGIISDKEFYEYDFLIETMNRFIEEQTTDKPSSFKFYASPRNYIYDTVLEFVLAKKCPNYKFQKIIQNIHHEEKAVQDSNIQKFIADMSKKMSKSGNDYRYILIFTNNDDFQDMIRKHAKQEENVEIRVFPYLISVQNQ